MDDEDNKAGAKHNEDGKVISNGDETVKREWKKGGDRCIHSWRMKNEREDVGRKIGRERGRFVKKGGSRERERESRQAERLSLSLSSVLASAVDAARIRPSGSTRREDHQSYRGECRVPCNHGAEPRADKLNQKR